MSTTRMNVANSFTVFHRVAASGDMPQTDITTNDTNVSSLGGSGSFQVEGDTDVTYSTANKQQGTSEATIGSGAISSFIYIKNTGFTTSDKDVSTTSDLTVGVGGAYASGGFTLSAGESIVLHGLASGSNDLGEFQLDSSSGNIYVEVVYL